MTAPDSSVTDTGAICPKCGQSCISEPCFLLRIVAENTLKIPPQRVVLHHYCRDNHFWTNSIKTEMHDELVADGYPSKEF